jgi:hypothetical protein
MDRQHMLMIESERRGQRRLRARLNGRQMT